MMEHNLDLSKYHRVDARTAFELDCRNSMKLYDLIKKYDTAGRIFVKRCDLDDPVFSSSKSVLGIIVLAAEKNTELEIFVDREMENYSAVAGEIKGFLEDRGNSAKDY